MACASAPGTGNWILVTIIVSPRGRFAPRTRFPRSARIAKAQAQAQAPSAHRNTARMLGESILKQMRRRRSASHEPPPRHATAPASRAPPRPPPPRRPPPLPPTPRRPHHIAGPDQHQARQPPPASPGPPATPAPACHSAMPRRHAREEAEQLLKDVYSRVARGEAAATKREKKRRREKAAFACRALVTSGTIPIIRSPHSPSDKYHACSFDRLAFHVVLRNELSGDVAAYQFSPGDSTAAVFAAARHFLKVTKAIPVRLWRDLPWIGRASKDALTATANAWSGRALNDTTIVAQAINPDVPTD